MNNSDELSQGSSIADSQIIEALDFDAPGSASAASPPSSVDSPASIAVKGAAKPNKTKAPWWHSQFNLMLAVFALLILTAGLFVLLTPPPNLTQDPSTQPLAATANTATVNADSQTPWTQSQLAKARADSQAVLSELLAVKNDLDKKNVSLWAAEPYQQALATADQGDELYKQQQFAEAISSYTAALTQLRGLFDLLPELIATRLADADTAISDGKSALAKQLYEEVLELDASNQPAVTGLARAATLDQVLDLMADAQRDEKQFESEAKLGLLTSAEQKLQNALAVDAIFQPATTALKRVREQITEVRFQAAMSDAYRALFANRYAGARKAFNQALKIKPGDKTAAAALQQSLASDTNSSISALLRDAKAFEGKEQWLSAYSNYQTVLQRDPNQISAKMGSLKSGVRQKLDEQINAVLADPLALSRAEPKAKAEKALADAKAISNKGSKLKDQIAQIETALTQVDKALKVQFTSDGITAVSLQKVGSKTIKLGSFTQKNLALKPGRYIATGVRIGYHDVRNEIELRPASGAIKPISIRCQRLIGS